MRNYAHWRVRRVLTVFLTTLLLVGSLIVPAGYLPIGVQSVAAETVVQSLTVDSSTSGFSLRTTASMAITSTLTISGSTHWLMQNGAGALKVTDTQTSDGAGGCIGLASPYYWSVTAGNWYEIRFLARTNGSWPNGMRFRVSSADDWGDNVVATTPITATGWSYQSFRFKGPGSGRIYPQWYTEGDTSGNHFYLDSIELVSQPEKLANNSFETDTSGWSVTLGTLTREAGGYAGYGAKLQQSGMSVASVAYQSFSASVGEYVTVDMWVKNGNAEKAVVQVGILGDSDKYLAREVSSTSWENIRYNFRAEDTTIYVFVSTYGDSYCYVYFDEVFAWSSRNELQAQFDYRSLAMHQIVVAETAATLADRYGASMPAEKNELPSRGMISLFLGEVWYKNKTAGSIATAEAFLEEILYHNNDLGATPYRWGDHWQASFELETLMLGVHWVWGDLANTDHKIAAFNAITDELNDYLSGPYASMKTSPTTSYASPPRYIVSGDGKAAHAIAWDLDYAGALYDRDTRAEDASAWGAAMAYASNVFTATSGNGYWANRQAAEDTSKDIMEMVISDNEDFTLWDSTSITNLRNVAVTDTHVIANHSHYPHPFYTVAILKPFTTAQFARRITGQAIPWQYEDDVADRMESDIWQDNWNSSVIQDSGYITSTKCFETGGSDGCAEVRSYIAAGEVLNRFKLYILPAWFYLYDDTDAMYEAQRTMRLIQDNPAFWPDPVQVVSSAAWSALTDQQRYEWWTPIYTAAEAYYQYSARWAAMEGIKYGLLPTGNQFVSAPLTW